MVIDVDGIKIEVTRKKVKNMRLVVSYSQGIVRLSAPLHTSDKVIYDFARSKSQWLKKHVSGGEFNSDPTKNNKKCRESVDLWGNRYDFQIVSGVRDEAFLDGDRVSVSLIDLSDLTSLESAINELYRKELSKALEEDFPRWEARLGLHASGVKIRDMKTRWGSCSVKSGRIRINLRLAELPRCCLEYVILHELAHLRYPDHGAEFKAFLGTYMPDWRRIRDSMRRG